MAIKKAYEGNEPYIFISYAHADSNKVIPIIQALQSRGFRVWYDAGIEAGSEWPEYIAAHLDGCACFLAFISKASLNSQNCRREINFAIELRKDPLAVYLEDVTLSLGMRMQLGTLQAMFYTRHNSMDSFMDALVASSLLKPCLGNVSAPAPKQAPQSASVTPVAAATAPTRAPAAKPAPAAPKKPMKEPTPAECYQMGEQYLKEGFSDDAYQWYRLAADKGHLDAILKMAKDTVSSKESFLWYQKAANMGHAYSQYWIAEAYRIGRGVTADQRNAFEWYQKAAQNGYDSAIFALGECYFYGKGVAEDKTKAFELYQKAYEAEYYDAPFKLAECYYHGYGVPQNREEAFAIYLEDAENGNDESQFMTGNMYLKGDGIKQDYDEAIFWLSGASDVGNPKAMAVLANCYLHGIGVEVDTEEAQRLHQRLRELGHAEEAEQAPDISSPTELKALGLDNYKNESYEQAVYWFQKLRDAGEPDGTFYLACCYAEGKGVPQDCIHALELYWSLPESYISHFRDTDHKNPSRQVLYSHIVEWYIRQLRQPEKYTEAELHAWLQKAASTLDDSQIITLTSDFDKNNLFTPALILYRGAAANKDNRYCKYHIGRYYHFGHGVIQSYEEAIKWYQASADTMWESCFALSLIYDQGLGVKRNWLLAQKWRIECTLRGGTPDNILNLTKQYHMESDRQEYKIK